MRWSEFHREFSLHNKSQQCHLLGETEVSAQSGSSQKVDFILQSKIINSKIHVFQDRPEAFESKAAEADWESSRREQVENLRQKIESGNFVPEEIRTKSAATDDKVSKDKQVSVRQEKVSN